MRWFVGLGAIIAAVWSPSIVATEALSKEGSGSKGVDLIIELHEPGLVGDEIILKMVNNTEEKLMSPMVRCVLLNRDGRAMDISSAFFDDIAPGEAGYEKLITMKSNVHSLSCKSQFLDRDR